MTGFTPDVVAGLLMRDMGCVLARIDVGRLGDCSGQLVGHHRLNRGMGGSRNRNGPGNGAALCWRHNDVIERDAGAATAARERGVKLLQGDDPEQIPMYHPSYRQMTQPTDAGLLLLGTPYNPRLEIAA